MMLLSDIDIGTKVKIKKIYVNDNIKHRLYDIGLIPETQVECVLKSLSGGSKAYLIRNTLIAIREEETSKIEVEVI